MEETLLYWGSQLTSLEFWQHLLDSFGDLGPLVPILLAMVESFVPPLPLIADFGKPQLSIVSLFLFGSHGSQRDWNFLQNVCCNKPFLYYKNNAKRT